MLRRLNKSQHFLLAFSWQKLEKCQFFFTNLCEASYNEHHPLLLLSSCPCFPLLGYLSFRSFFYVCYHTVQECTFCSNRNVICLFALHHEAESRLSSSLSCSRGSTTSTPCLEGVQKAWRWCRGSPTPKSTPRPRNRTKTLTSSTSP